MHIFLRRLLFGLLISALFPFAYASQGRVRAEVYFIPWDVSTAYRLSPEHVRKQAEVFVRINGEVAVENFSKILPLEKLAASDVPVSGDARLVIDIYDRKGDRTSYYADQFRFMTLDGRKSIDLDENFKRIFFPFLSSRSN
jgi:hypothetical protein